MRNPENIDLVKFPPPPGYVVASEEDFYEAKECDPEQWLAFNFNDKCWRNVAGWVVRTRPHWTYLRPITPEDQGDKYDTDHMFPG